MAALLNSNVARLVLSYLSDENLDQAYSSFCETSKYLAEERELWVEKRLKSINQSSLVEILSDHLKSKCLVDQFIKEIPNSSNYNQTQTAFIFDKLAFIVESVRPLLHSQPQSMRKRHRNDSTDEQNLPKRARMDAASYTTIVNNAIGTVEMFSETILNNERYRAAVTESINKHSNLSNLNYSLNVNMDEAIQELMDGPLCEGLMEDVLDTTVPQEQRREEYGYDEYEEEEVVQQPEESQPPETSRRKNRPKKMETSTPYPQIDESIKTRLRTRKSPLPDPEILQKESNTKSVKKKPTKKIISSSKKINVISNEKIQDPILQYQQIINRNNDVDYVLVPMCEPICYSVENDLLQILPTPQIVKEDPPPLSDPPLLNSQIIEEKLDNKLGQINKVNNTPKSVNLLHKSPNLTPSHVRILDFATVPKMHKSTPKTIMKTQSLHKTSTRFELSGDEDENAIKKPVLGNFEEDSSSLDCNQTVIENRITNTPRSKGFARKCVRVLSRSGSENGGDEGGGESSNKEDEKKDLAKIEWEAQRKLTNKDFDQSLRMQHQQQITKINPKKKPVKKTENVSDETEVKEKIYIKYPTPKKKKKTQKKKLKTIKPVEKSEDDPVEPKEDESIEPVNEIIETVLVETLQNEPVVDPVIEPVIEPYIEPVIEPVVDQIIEPDIIPLIIITTDVNKTQSNISITEFNEPIGFETTLLQEPKTLELSLNVSSLLETPYKFDPTCFPNTPRFLVPQVQQTPITKSLKQFNGGPDGSSMKNCDIQTPIFPITPGANTTPPISPTSGCYNRPTDYSSSSSYYKPDETEMSARSIRRDSDYEEIVEMVKKAQENEESPVKNCRRKKSFFQEPEDVVKISIECDQEKKQEKPEESLIENEPETVVKEIVAPVIPTTSLDLSTETFRTPAKEVNSDSSSSDSSSSKNSSSSSSSESEEDLSPIKPIIKSKKEKPIVEEKIIKKKENDFYEERERQQTQLELKRQRIMKKINAEPPKPSYLTKKQHILARKVPTKKISFISPSKRKSTNPGKLIYLEEPPSIKPQRLKNVKQSEKVSKPTASDNSDNAVQSDVLVDEHFTGQTVDKNGSSEESLDLIQKHLDSKIIAPVIVEGKDDLKKINTDLIAELEGEAIEKDKKTEELNEDSSSDESEEWEKWNFCNGNQIEMKRDSKFKCSEKNEPLDFTKTTKLMFDEDEYCRISFSEPINIFEMSPTPPKRQYRKKPMEPILYSFSNVKNKNKTPNAKFNLKQKARPGTSSNDGDINSILDLIHGSK